MPASWGAGDNRDGTRSWSATVQLPEGWTVEAAAGEGDPNPGIGMCKGTGVREYGELQEG